ncbi:MAG: bile acid:sodium symporter family protein [Gammaproteobacteria bacterium]|nr:MAG: bile acid:sodium symporter family protein [Gammaproteobacteria bacterium]RLA34972.1 MAG: bile acid:sodium symporter family protein [Gammaproteobacteria bacterium]
MSFLEAFYTEFVPFFLFTVMMAMGLALTLQDLKQVLIKPKAIIAGLSAQLLLLPAMTIGLGFLFSSPPVIAAGAIILAACPGGVTSNAYVFSARADIALSVGLTAIASMVTVFSIPFLTLFALDLHLDRSEMPALSALQMTWTLAQFTIIPVALGMLFRAWQPGLAKKSIEPLRIITLIALILIAAIGTINAWDTIVENIWTAGILMATINIVAMSLGYGLGNLLRLPFKQMATITFEVGVQNLSMALFVCLTFLKSPELAVATLVYALFMKITALSFVWYVRKKLDEPALAVRTGD